MAFAFDLARSSDQSKSIGSIEQLWAEALWTLLPIWVAVLAGLVLGWSWKPKWVTLCVVALRSRPRLVWSLPPGLGARRLWLAATAAAAAPTLRDTLAWLRRWAEGVRERWLQMQAQLRSLRPEEVATFLPAGRLTARAKMLLLKDASPSPSPLVESTLPLPVSRLTPCPRLSLAPETVSSQEAALLAGLGATVAAHLVTLRSERRTNEVSSTSSSGSSSSASGSNSGGVGSLEVVSPSSSAESPQDGHGCEDGGPCSHGEVVSEEDLAGLLQKLEDMEGTKTGQAWGLLMEKKTQRMTYTAWRRDPQNGPTEYRSRSVVDECAPETMRDFFWDDDFRPEWDGMLAEWSTLESCPATGLQVVRWVRKFPLFCKDREYIIGRRIWSHGNTYYCITKGLAQHPDVPRKDRPRRVDQFYSSWRIQPLEGGSTEVLLFHQEDMGIQRDVAKMGVRQAMWGAVKKIEPGVRSFCRSRSQLQLQDPACMPRSLSMAKLNTPLTDQDLVSPTARRGTVGLGDQKRVRKWVSSLDLTQVEAAAEACDRSNHGRSDSSPGASLGREHGDGGSPQAKAGGSGRLSFADVVVSAEQSASTSEAETARSSSSECPGASHQGRERMELVERKLRDVQPAGRKGRHLRLAIAATAVAFVCGLETGLLVKIALAGAVRHALTARRGRRDS